MKMNTKGEKGDCLHDCIYVSRKKLFPSVSESSSFQIIWQIHFHQTYYYIFSLLAGLNYFSSCKTMSLIIIKRILKIWGACTDIISENMI